VIECRIEGGEKGGYIFIDPLAQSTVDKAAIVAGFERLIRCSCRVADRPKDVRGSIGLRR
jgi:hypothetical protein